VTSEEAEEPEEPGPIMTFNSYAGHYELTAYIETGNPCADGVYPEVGHTAACNDPKLWHKWIHIEGYGDYFVHDTGGMASNVIDLFVGSYDEAIQFGRREAEVYIIE
jgi:3D (Asp-Asp-Asp) domain-containing protein